MTTLFGYRQRAEKFAARVDGTPGSGADRPETRRRSGAAADETDALVDVVAGLRRHAEHCESARPREAFVADLRERLLAEAALSPVRQHGWPDETRSSVEEIGARPRRVRERLVVAGAAAAIVIGGTAGVANAAQRALPGQALYPVKRSLESVDARLSGSPSAHGRTLLDQASTRLDEVRALNAGSPLERELVPNTLDDFTKQANEGALLLMRGFRETDDPKSIAEVRAFAANQLPLLSKLSVSTSDGAQSQLRHAAVALRSIDTEATDVCSDCSDLAPLDIPPLTLSSVDVAATPDASGTAAGDLLSGDEGATADPDTSSASLPSGPGMTPSGTPTNGVALLPAGAGSTTATPAPTGSAMPGSTTGPSPTAGATTGTGAVVGTGTSTGSGAGTGASASSASPGSAPATTGAASGSATVAPPRVSVPSTASGGSTLPDAGSPAGGAAPAPAPTQPAASSAPVLTTPSTSETSTPEASPSAAPSEDSSSTSGSSSSASAGSTTSGDADSTSGTASTEAGTGTSTSDGKTLEGATGSSPLSHS
jgi:hypothetical protein